MKNQSTIKCFVLSLVLVVFANCENNEISSVEQISDTVSVAKSNLRAAAGLSVSLKTRMAKPGGQFVIYFSGGSPNEKVGIEDPIMRTSTFIKLNASGIGAYTSKVESWVKPSFYAYKINNTYESVSVISTKKWHQTRRNIYLGNATKISDFKYPACYTLYTPKTTDQQIKEAGEEILREAFLAYTDSKYKRFVLAVTSSTCAVTIVLTKGATAKPCAEWLMIEAKSYLQEVGKQTLLYAIKNNTVLNEKTKTSIRLLLANTETAMAVAEYKDGSLTNLENIDSVLSSAKNLTFELVNSGFFTATYKTKDGRIVCIGVCKK